MNALAVYTIHDLYVRICMYVYIGVYVYICIHTQFNEQ